MSRKPAPGSSRNYFTQETENWIIEYNKEQDSVKKDRIFTEHLYFPFYKLVESIIHTFKFYYTDVEAIEDLKLDVISMLIQENKLTGFDPSRGCKAFSYFGTIVKRWLINYNNTNYKRKKSQVQIINYDEAFADEREEMEVFPSLYLSEFLDQWVNETEENIDRYFTTDEEKKVALAILTVFRSRKDIPILKKRAFYIYVREITGCETVYLSKILTKLKDLFYTKYKKYVQEGYLDPDRRV